MKYFDLDCEVVENIYSPWKCYSCAKNNNSSTAQESTTVQELTDVGGSRFLFCLQYEEEKQ